MISLDTNVLARYYIADVNDSESVRQRESARRLIEAGTELMVCKTVLLELEWVMRGYYDFQPEQIMDVLQHLLSLAHISIEDREIVEDALSNYRDGLDFADALHHASYSRCEAMASFDDRKFARRAKRLGLIPSVMVPMWLHHVFPHLHGVPGFKEFHLLQGPSNAEYTLFASHSVWM